MAGQGGAREGAGRPRNAEKYGRSIAEYSDRCADHLVESFERLLDLIRGAVRVESRRARAGTVVRKDVVRDAKGTPIADRNGKFTAIEIKVFPDLKDDELVVVEEKQIVLPPDIRAIQCLTERICGRAIDAEVEAPVDPEAERLALRPQDLETLPIEDLDALESIARKLAEGRPRVGARDDPGGEDAAAGGELR